MPRKARALSAIEVKRLTEPGLHPVGGVPGLLLRVSQTGSASWILRTTIAGKRRDIGLGGFPEVSLSKARNDAGEVRDKIRAGVDPIAERQAARAALLAAQAAQTTFAEAARQCHQSKAQEFRNPKHAAQWINSIETYAAPIIGKLSVDEIDVAHVVKVLEPIWTEKTETAVRLRGRMESVFAWAIARGYRSGDNPARWKGLLDAILPAPTKIAKVQHFKAMPVGEIGAFMEKLRQREGIGARALEFTILTAARSGEVRGATWDEIDLQAKTWTVPGDRMKAGRPHAVPLSEDAVNLLENLPRFEGTDLVFPAPRRGKLSDATLGAVLKRMDRTETVHGFRSTFSDWAAERTGYPSEVREMALAHSIADKTEKAYRRGDLLQKRRRMMADWAKFVATAEKTDSNVTSLREAQ